MPIDLPDPQPAGEAMAAARRLLPAWVPWLGPVLWLLVVSLGGFLSTWLALRVQARQLAAAVDEPWTERARIFWPFRQSALIALLAAAGVGLVLSAMWTGPLQVLPIKWLIAGSALVGYIAGLYAVWLLRQPARPIKLTALLREIAVEWLLHRPVLPVLLLMLLSMPREFGARAAVVAVTGVALQLVLVRGGSLWLLRRLGWLIDAPAELKEVSRDLASRIQKREPQVGVLRSARANAFAMPMAHEVIVTSRALECLDTDALRSILKHEVGHLAESRGVHRLRVAMSVVPLLYAVVMPLSTWIGVRQAVLGLLLLIVIAVRLYASMSRGLEHRADRFAIDHGEDPRTYTRALESLHRENLIPAVFTRPRSTHPDLLARFEAAGIEPDWPRPEPPPRGPLLRSLAVLAIVWAAILVPPHYWRSAAPVRAGGRHSSRGATASERGTPAV